MKKQHKIMFGLVKKVFITLFSFNESLRKVFDHAKCISLNNQKCMIRPSLIDFNHHGAEISVIGLVERSAIKLLILICY